MIKVVCNIPGWYEIEIQDIRTKVLCGVRVYRHGGREAVTGDWWNVAPH